MPHIIVKLYPGRTEEQKVEVTARIVDVIMDALKISSNSISVGIEEVAPEDWTETVYKPDIVKKEFTLYKKPGYKP